VGGTGGAPGATGGIEGSSLPGNEGGVGEVPEGGTDEVADAPGNNGALATDGRGVGAPEAADGGVADGWGVAGEESAGRAFGSCGEDVGVLGPSDVPVADGGIGGAVEGPVDGAVEGANGPLLAALPGTDGWEREAESWLAAAAVGHDTTSGDGDGGVAGRGAVSTYGDGAPAASAYGAAAPAASAYGAAAPPAAVLAPAPLLGSAPLSAATSVRVARMRISCTVRCNSASCTPSDWMSCSAAFQRERITSAATMLTTSASMATAETTKRAQPSSEPMPDRIRQRRKSPPGGGLSQRMRESVSALSARGSSRGR